MKKNNTYKNDVDYNYGWIFILILVFLFGCAIFGGYLLYQHANSPDNNYSFSEHTDLRDISDTNTATNLYNTITTNAIYYDMFYKEKLSNIDYLSYGFTRTSINVPSLYGERFTVLKNKLDTTIKNAFYNENETTLYQDDSYNNYQYRCSYNSESSLYDCISITTNSSLAPILYSSFIKVEQENEFFYVYDKAVYVKSNEQTSSFYTDINFKNEIFLCDNALQKATSVCTGLTDNDKELKEYIFKQYDKSINTYKHTFIKENGNYYFKSTEIVKEEA